MKKGDYLMCTFSGDTNNPPIQYVAEITRVEASDFSCILPDTQQQFTFEIGNQNEAWNGKDQQGVLYIINTHNIYSAGAVGPSQGNVVVITFADGKKYFGYVNRLSPDTEIIFYQFGNPTISINNNVVVKSNWDAYPVNTTVVSCEGYILNNDTTNTSPADIASGKSNPGSKFLFVDVSPWEKNPNWNALINTPDFYGAILKATQGIKGWTNDGGWFEKNWKSVKDIGSDRYGRDWFRGAYLFLNFWQDGSAQADNYLETIDKAGGWDKGDILPIIDVELGNDGSNGKPRSKNQDASTQTIIDCTTACADRLRSQTGRNIILYGRGAMRDKGIKSKMGCDQVWNPAYTATMVRNGLDAWSLDEIVLWQYAGDGIAAIDKSKFPHTIPGFGNTDISVYIQGAEKPSFDKMVERLGINQFN